MFKIVIPVPGEKRAVQVEKDVPTLVGMKIGERFDGSMIGLNGYVLQVTGGSDKDGFPMRRDLPGTARKRVLLVSGVGCKPKGKGIRKIKTIRGNRIGEDISQVNVKIVEKGKESVEKLLGLEKKEEKKEGEAKKDEPKKEEVKPELKKEAETPKETKTEEKPAEPEEKPKETTKEDSPKEESKEKPNEEKKEPEATENEEIKPEKKEEHKTEEKKPAEPEK
ncbi:MAG: 30S ribosomal protein S6e [Candidatus Aenigmarchaeota archaeon]|nr:30S ribosomal protein S6e [Candidatus Aenigmarchaeota archaeon]